MQYWLGKFSGLTTGELLLFNPQNIGQNQPNSCSPFPSLVYVILYCQSHLNWYVYKVAPPVRWALVFVVNSPFTAFVKSTRALDCMALCWRLAECVLWCVLQAFNVVVSCFIILWLVRKPRASCGSPLGEVEGAPLWTWKGSSQNCLCFLFISTPHFPGVSVDGVGAWDLGFFSSLICQVLHY